MIRITEVSQSPEEVVLRVDGYLTKRDVELLMAEGNRWLEQADRLVLSMIGTPSVNLPGIHLLQQWVDERITLKNGPGTLRILLRSHGLEVLPEAKT